MNGLKQLIEQQHEFEAYNSEKARQLGEHVDHLKYLITTEFLTICKDFEHEIKEENTLIFKYKDLSLSIHIINPMTEKRNEKEYNLAERAAKKLTIKLSIQRKKNAELANFEVFDITQYEKNGPYTYKYSTNPTENFLELLDLFFNYVSNQKVEFQEAIDLF